MTHSHMLARFPGPGAGVASPKTQQLRAEAKSVMEGRVSGKPRGAMPHGSPVSDGQKQGRSWWFWFRKEKSREVLVVGALVWFFFNVTQAQTNRQKHSRRRTGMIWNVLTRTSLGSLSFGHVHV